jgi:hypothetical protein
MWTLEIQDFDTRVKGAGAGSGWRRRNSGCSRGRSPRGDKHRGHRRRRDGHGADESRIGFHKGLAESGTFFRLPTILPFSGDRGRMKDAPERADSTGGEWLGSTARVEITRGRPVAPKVPD